jgi:hypothetical protein
MAGRSSQLESRALPKARLRFARLLEALRDDDRPGFVLAELNDLLSGLTSGDLSTENRCPVLLRRTNLVREVS